MIDARSAKTDVQSAEFRYQARTRTAGRKID
jgi:hypothetical protein